MYIRLIAIGCLISKPAFADEPISFNEHIRPILSDNCFACHGQDAEHREADLRLDTAAGAEQVLSPGDWENSELWHRISTEDTSEQMPPVDSLKTPLSKEQLDLVRRWIEQGAIYEDHWAFAPVTHPPLPQTDCGMVGHPVDRFIQAKLAEHDLSLSPQAAPETLLRRVTLDLTGLPPTPEEVDRFVADTAPDAYERLVDRLLASPQYGEHFARYWLDAVRYADTHGRHFDNVRSIWPYRDWVVQAFNRNLAFDQFTIEQLAGDLLPNPRIDQLVASGYNRNLQTTSEAGSIEAEEEMRTTADRVDTTAAVWMGLTTNCASCHDHKFDPLTQKEVYSLGAIFKGLDVRPWDGNVRFAGPVAVVADTPSKQNRIDEITSDVESLEAAVTRRADALIAGGFDLPELTEKAITYEVIWAEDADLPTPKNVIGPPLSGQWRGGAGVPLVDGQRALQLKGRVERPIAFTAGDVVLTVGDNARAFVSVYLDPVHPPRAISLDFISQEKTCRKVWGDAAAFTLESPQDVINAGPLPSLGEYAVLKLTAAEAGLEQGKDYTGLRLAQSGGQAWWDHVGAEYTSPSAKADPLLSKSAWVNSVSSRAHEYPPTISLRHDISYLVGVSSVQQTDEEKLQLTNWYRDYIYAPLRGALEPEVHAARRLLAEQIHYESNLPVTLVSSERDEPLPAYVMLRGQYDHPGERVQATTPAFLPPIDPEGERLNRLDFARWLVSSQHPLTSRVTVNRFWQQLFGAGLVRTPGDFGVQGEPQPIHSCSIGLRANSGSPVGT